MSPPRSTTIRDRHRAVIKRRRDPCGICGADIDYELPFLHPKSFVIDHVIPLNRGGRRPRQQASRMPGTAIEQRATAYPTRPAQVDAAQTRL
jgi:hypothetical protein